MCSCDQSLVTLAFLWEKLSQPQFYKDLTRKIASFEEWFWFKFNNLRLALGRNFQIYTILAKELKLKFRRFSELILTFLEVTGETLVGGRGREGPRVWIITFPHCYKYNSAFFSFHSRFHRGPCIAFLVKADFLPFEVKINSLWKIGDNIRL